MNQLKHFIERVKREYARNKKAVIKKIFLVIIGIAIFVSGYLLSSNFLEMPISNCEFEFYEQVAADLYNKGYVAIQEVAQEELSIKITNTSIIISSTNSAGRGKVIANFQSGELVITRDAEIPEAIFVNTVMGLLWVFVFTLTNMLVQDIYKDIKTYLKKRKDK